MNDKPKRLWQPDVTLALLSAMGADTMFTHLGIEITELGDDYLKGTMPVDIRTCQPMRVLHGGASVVLAESLGSLAGNAVVDGKRFACVGQEINANHLRPVPMGNVVTGIARPIHLGGRSHVWGIEIFNEREQLICISRLTLAVINR